MQSDFEPTTIEDFICEESFQRWTQGSASEKEKDRWDQYYFSHPEKKEIIDQARVLVIGLTRDETEIPKQKVNQSWNKLEERIDTPTKSPKVLRWVGYAAVVAIAALTSLWVYQSVDVTESEFTYYQSGYGEKTTVDLPDGTKIILNANSKIRVPEVWDNTNRQVWLLSGEAFFEVEKTEDRANFLVQTSSLSVEVLGTKFTVKARTPETEVLLTEGKVKLKSQSSEMYLEPGELATLTREGLYKKTVNVSRHQAWLNDKVILNNSSLEQIARIIKTYYNKDVQIAKGLEDKRLTGELPTNNLEFLLESLKVSLAVNITRTGDTIIVRDRD